MSGNFISLGCIVNMRVGGVEGAFLFSFGLISVCLYGLKLYTGTAGFINHLSWQDHKSLSYILLWNVVGCLLTVLLLGSAPGVNDVGYQEAVNYLVEKRYYAGASTCFWLAVGCGIIMTTIVEFYRSYKTLIPILIGIPVFILSGFTHSIADSFYFLLCDNKSWYLLWIWLAEVMGNYIGCSLYSFLRLRN